MSDFTGNQNRIAENEEEAFLMGQMAQSTGDFFAMLGRDEEARGEYLAAIDAYNQVLPDSPDFANAQNNKEIVQEIVVKFPVQDELNLRSKIQRLIKIHQEHWHLETSTGYVPFFASAASLTFFRNAYHLLRDYTLGNAYDKAIEFIELYKESLLEAELGIGNRQREANFLGSASLGYQVDNLGNVHYFRNHYPEAINFLQQSLAIARERRDSQGEVASLGSLGNVCYSQGDYKEAINFYKQSWLIAREIGDRQGEANSLNNLGSAYYNLGNAYYSQGDYKEAIEFYQQSWLIAREIGDRQGEVASLGSVGNVYYSLERYKEAINFHRQSLEIAKHINISLIQIKNQEEIISLLEQIDIPSSMLHISPNETLLSRLSNKLGITISNTIQKILLKLISNKVSRKDANT